MKSSHDVTASGPSSASVRSRSANMCTMALRPMSARARRTLIGMSARQSESPRSVSCRVGEASTSS
ncbi:Uncharacterised protein [Mycobacteroides abscessus subsp. abscessus]|nr:Uncharacterised protein [Mycobacteroides abscessus subsp. abscessus]